MTPDGAAAKTGKLRTGDRILKVHYYIRLSLTVMYIFHALLYHTLVRPVLLLFCHLHFEPNFVTYHKPLHAVQLSEFVCGVCLSLPSPFSSLCVRHEPAPPGLQVNPSPIFKTPLAHQSHPYKSSFTWYTRNPWASKLNVVKTLWCTFRHVSH